MLFTQVYNHPRKQSLYTYSLIFSVVQRFETWLWIVVDGSKGEDQNVFFVIIQLGSKCAFCQWTIGVKQSYCSTIRCSEIVNCSELYLLRPL